MTSAIIAVLAAVVFREDRRRHERRLTRGAAGSESGRRRQRVAFNAGFGVMMLGAAGCLLTRAGSYRWLGWIAVVLGIALFIPFADFIALILTLIWILVVSVLLFRHATAAQPDAAGAGQGSTVPPSAA